MAWALQSHRYWHSGCLVHPKKHKRKNILAKTFKFFYTAKSKGGLQCPSKKEPTSGSMTARDSDSSPQKTEERTFSSITPISQAMVVTNPEPKVKLLNLASAKAPKVSTRQKLQKSNRRS